MHSELSLPVLAHKIGENGFFTNMNFPYSFSINLLLIILAWIILVGRFELDLPLLEVCKSSPFLLLLPQLV